MNTTANAGVNVDLSAYKPSDSSMNEAELNRYYTAHAFRFIKQHPGRVARLYLLKFLNYFNYRNQLYTKFEAGFTRDLVMLVTYGALLLCVVLRLVTARPPPDRFEKFLIILYVLNGAFAAIFFTRIRFRVPFDLLLVVVAAPLLAKTLRGVFQGLSGWAFPSARR
jgi:hypothetical protein